MTWIVSSWSIKFPRVPSPFGLVAGLFANWLILKAIKVAIRVVTNDATAMPSATLSLKEKAGAVELQYSFLRKHLSIFVRNFCSAPNVCEYFPKN